MVKITALPTKATPSGSETVVIVDNGVTKQASFDSVAQAALNAIGAGPAGAKGDPGGVDAATAAVINEAQAALGSKGDKLNFVLFTAGGNYSPSSSSVYAVRIIAQGGGGGGGGGPSVASGTATSGGGGGGGGARAEGWLRIADIATPVAVTVGAGGAGGAGASAGGGNGTAGGNGGDSTFGTYLKAAGGGGGGPGSTATSGGGGAGGLTTGGAGSATFGFGGSGAANGSTGGAGSSSAASGGGGGAGTAVGGGGNSGGHGFAGGGGGGSGGGLTATPTQATGGAGGRTLALPAGNNGGAVGGGAGATAAALGAGWYQPGGGGGGGGSNTGGVGGAGGAGQAYGGGGGGGGASLSTSAGGAGGAGGAGFVLIVEYLATPTALPPVISGGGVATPAQSSSAIAAPVYGSAKFPDFNGQYAGAYGLISQPTTNFGTWWGADGGLFLEVEIPQERMLEPRQFYLFGNGTPGGGKVALSYFGNSYSIDTTKRGKFEFYVGNTSGQSITIDSPAIPATVQRALIYIYRSGGNFTLAVMDIDTGTVYSTTTTTFIQFPSTATALASFTGITTFANGAVQIGDNQNGTTAERGSFNGTQSAWTGSVGKIGYAAVAVADANFEAIRTGTDPLIQFGAGLKWYRALDGGASSLLRLAAATGDTTSAAVAYGRIGQGGHLAQTCNVQLGRVPDGLVFACLPGERFARVRLPFTCKGIASTGDVLEIRVLDSTGVPVLDWASGALLASGQTGGTAEVTCPISARWLKAETRLKSNRAATNMAPGLFGVGAGCGLLGQSQIANGMGRAGLANGYDGQTAASLAWTITSQSVTGTVLWRLDQGKIVSDMLSAACQQAARVYPGAQGWIVDAVGGTSPDQLIDDGESTRTWTQWAGVVTQARGQLSTILFPWFTSLAAANPVTPIANQLDAALRGRGPVAKAHFLFEGGFLPNGGTVVVYPGSRHQVTGTATADNSVTAYGTPRDAMRAWVAARQEAGDTSFLIGPEQIVTTVDSYHPADVASGDVRLGYSLGVGLGIGMRTFTLAEAYVDGTSFAFTDGGRTAFTFDIVTPGNTPICNFLGATYNSGADKGVMGVQVSTDGGASYGYLPASACQITGRFRVTCTKPSGAWSAGLKVQVMSGGPLAYGASNPDSDTAAINYGLGDGDARMLTGFGNPIKCANTVYSVAG